MKLRHLRLQLMHGYRRRGRLLSEVKHLVSLSTTEHACIALHTHWESFVKAEEWNHARQQRCPATPASALQLIVRWQQAGKPDVFITRLDGVSWYACKQTKMGLFYLSLLGHYAFEVLDVLEGVGLRFWAVT